MKIIVITGPTAAGKTALAVRLARRLGGEIISADSRQVYRGLDIGSGKDLAEYGTGPDRVKAHLLDIADPAAPEQYSLADFMRDAKRAVRDIVSRGKVPVICGGTGLYLHALIRGYTLPGGPGIRSMRDALASVPAEELADGAELSCGEETNRYRLIRRAEIRASGETHAPEGGGIEGASYLVIGSYRPRAEIRERIGKRLDERFAGNMTDEVRSLHEERSVSWERLRSFGLEYGMISRYLQGEMSFDAMHDALLAAIRQFAKRQDTWFRKMEKEGIPIYWINPDETDRAENLCRAFLAGEHLAPPEGGLPKNPPRS